MRSVISGLSLSLSMALAVPALAAGKDKSTASAKADKADQAQNLSPEEQRKLKEHMRLRDHIVKKVKYPASKEEIVRADRLKDIKADDRKWFTETLPDRTYSSPEEVMKAIGWEVPAETATDTRAERSERGESRPTK